MENRAFGALAAALLLCCAYAAPVTSEPLRVLYAEPFQAQTTSTPGAQKPGPANLRVRAFGRTFDLELEDNSRLLRATSAQARERLGAIQLFKGSIKDAPGSWVRLTLSGDRYSGAFWDGSELYAIAPREMLEGALLAPLPAAATAIYRLSDTQGGLFAGTCALDSRARTESTPTQKFRALLRELKSAAAAATAPREIEVAMIGDFEFTNRLGGASLATMIDHMNVVDGIFSNQVGVATVPTDFITFGSNIDPFTANDASSLLTQFATYRDTSPTVRSRGLAHLLTGRELLGNTIGIAFLGSLCAPREGVSLSESSAFIDSALIMAHELGHNFGAPHDGEPGSACAATSSAFLMGPSFNGNSTFSACSLQQMQPQVDAASCVVAARNREVAVAGPSDTVFALINEPFDVSFDVSSLGSVAASNVVLSVPVPFSENVLSTVMPGAACSVEFSTVRCRLASLDAGTSARLTIRMRHPASALLNLAATVAAVGDSNAANNVATARVRVAQATDFDLTATPVAQTVPRNAPFEMTFDVAAIGTETLNGMQLEVFLGAATLLSFSIDNGSCSAPTNPVLACQLGTMAPGERRRVRAQLVSDRIGPLGGFARIFAATNPGFTRSAFFDINIQPIRDISLTANPQSKLVAIGTDATWPVEVHSNGVQAVNDVHVRVSAPAGVALSVDGSVGAGCSPIAGGLDCSIGTVAAGAVTPFTLRARANAPLLADIELLAVLPTQDDVPSNDRRQLLLDARVGSEISVREPSVNVAAFEGHTHTLIADVVTSGANATRDVRVAIALPQDFTISSAQLSSQQCTVRAGASNLADCTIASLEANRVTGLILSYVPGQPGTFAGSVTVSASEDADASNNMSALNFDIAPNVDARLVAPPEPRIAVGVGADLVFTVATNKYALPDASVHFVRAGELDEFSATAPGGTCGQGPQDYVCTLGTIAANSSVPVTLHIRGSIQASVSIFATLASPAETNTTDNRAFVTVPILPPGDLAVSVVNPSPSTTVGEQWHLLIDVNVISEVFQPYFDLQFDAAQTTLFGTMNGTTCQSTTPPVRCTISASAATGVVAPGTYRADVILIPRSAGAASITVRAGALNDFNAGNDTQVVTATAANPPPPPPPPTPSAPPSGGGGGGGSMSWLLAALLLAMWHHRRTRLQR